MMRVFSAAVVVFGTIGLSWASPATTARKVVHEKRAFDPPGWTRDRKLRPDVVLPMRFGCVAFNIIVFTEISLFSRLTQNNIHRVEEFLMDVSHPKSPNYGKHWTADKIAETFSPSKATIDAVRSWLTSSGFATERLKLSPSKGWIEVNATATEVENLLDAEYHVYAHESGSEHIGLCSCFMLIFVRLYNDM